MISDTPIELRALRIGSGTAALSAAMLSQICSTRSSRSSTARRSMPSDLMETDMALPVFPRCHRCYQLTSSRAQARITPAFTAGPPTDNGAHFTDDHRDDLKR